MKQIPGFAQGAFDRVDDNGRRRGSNKVCTQFSHVWPVCTCGYNQSWPSIDAGEMLFRQYRGSTVGGRDDYIRAGYRIGQPIFAAHIDTVAGKFINKRFDSSPVTSMHEELAARILLVNGLQMSS